MQTPDRCSLIPVADASVALAVAGRFLPSAWSHTEAFLGQGGAAARLDAEEPTADHPLIAAPLEHRYTNASGQDAALTITIASGLAQLLCERHFGGGQACKSKRGLGRVALGLAAQLAKAMLADCDGDWRPLPIERATSLDVRTATCVSISAYCPMLDAAGPHVAITLTGQILAGDRAVSAADDWHDRLDALVRSVRLPVRSVLAQPLLSAGEIARLAIGDVIPIRAPDRVTLLAGVERIGCGLLGERDGHAAVTLAPTREFAE